VDRCDLPLPIALGTVGDNLFIKGDDSRGVFSRWPFVFSFICADSLDWTNDAIVHYGVMILSYFARMPRTLLNDTSASEWFVTIWIVLLQLHFTKRVKYSQNQEMQL
jgi:hypothetical protein